MKWEFEEGSWQEVLSDLGLGNKSAIPMQMRRVIIRHAEDYPGSRNRVCECMRHRGRSA